MRLVAGMPTVYLDRPESNTEIELASHLPSVAGEVSRQFELASGLA